MAYDQNAAYEPPRRAYLDQRDQHPNPGYTDYANYAEGPYDQYGQDNSNHYQTAAYDQGYTQQPTQPQDRSYDRHQERGYDRPQKDDRYHQERRDERQYDPRYQSRSQRGPPPPQHHPSQPNGQSQRPHRPPGAPPPHRGDPRGPMSNSSLPPNAQRTRDPYVQQNGIPPQSSRQRDPYEQQNTHQPQGQRPRDGYNSQADQPASAVNGQRTSMEDWKAREKARMKNQAMSPESMPFDNAFPVFGNPKKDPRPSARSGTDRGNNDPAQMRPRTSNGPRTDFPRDTSHQSDPNIRPPRLRPDMERQYSAPDIGNAQPNASRASDRDAYGNQLEMRQPISQPATTPTREQYPEQWPMVAGQTPPKSQPQRQSPPQVNGHDPRYASNARGPHVEQSYNMPAQHIEPRGAPKHRAPPPIDTAAGVRQSPPVYLDHQPLSPANVPPRPSTSHAQRTQVSSPLAQQPPPMPQDGYSYPSKPWAQEQHTRHESLGDIYDDYGAEPAPPKPQLRRAPTTREEEIESEMPDFDSAAPGQTSQLQKRAGDRQHENPQPAAAPPLLPRTQTAPPNAMAHSQPPRDPRYAEQAPPQQYGSTSGPGQRGPPRRGMTDPYGETPLSARPDQQYDMPYRNGPPQDPAYQQGRPLPPPQAPFANEPQVRRSMDDARGPPNQRAPPPPQRFYQGGQPPPRALPQQRPDLDRNGTWSDPMQERGGSAPPTQRGFGEPPMVVGGAALTPQQSAPERNSNPDALPHHPVPVRAGHMQSGQPQSNKPPPARNYHGSNTSNGAPQPRQASLDLAPQPITHAELDRLRAAADSTNSPKQNLILIKRLVEASSVLANENGRVDTKTAAKNRERYINEAYKRLKKIVASGYPDAQFYMADCHGQGTLGLEVDTKEAFKLYQAAAKAGHAQAAYRTAVCCEMGPEEGGGTSRDYPKAVQWYRRAAALGDAAAMYKLGAVLLKGLLGQQRNITEAVIWLKRGAERADKENPHALHELATLYESTNTHPEVRNKVVADDGYARELFQQAAHLGYKFSQFRLGQAYEYGALGLTIDNRSSIAWYTKAAAQGEHQAELALSGWYLTGADGILEHSDTEAYLWARKAASSEPPLAKAMFAMGYFTENGIGCPASLDEARKWYGRSASYKFPKAVERLEELKRSGGKNAAKPPPVNGKLTRKDQKRDEENCVVM